MLFDTSERDMIDTDIPVISSNFNMLFFDEFPILYSGTNSLSNIVVGSLLCEDEDEDIFRYVQFIANPKDYALFIKQRLAYRDFIEKQPKVFLLDKDARGNVLKTYYVDTSTIPQEYLPVRGFMCPQKNAIASGLEYSVTLKGGLADMQEAVVGTVSEISKKAKQLLTDIIEAIPLPRFNPKVNLMPYTGGSFKINLAVRYETNDLHFNTDKYNALLAKLVDYSFNELASETEKIISGEIKGTVFERLRDEIESVSQQFTGNFTDLQRDQLMNKVFSIPVDLDKMASHIGEGFDYFTVDNKGNVPLAIVNEDIAQEFSKAADLIAVKDAKDVKVDDDYHSYTVTIYHLNRKTRNGNAFIVNELANNSIDMPSIKIEGKEPLNNTKFTESIHNNSSIVVEAKAKRVDGRFKLLTIKF